MPLRKRCAVPAVITSAGCGHPASQSRCTRHGRGRPFSSPGIFPRLLNEEKDLLTRFYSAAGELTADGHAITRRSMRSIHHTALKQSIVGGGSGMPRPGEITMAHLGGLFLDEIAEFSSATLEALRQPIEAGEITVTRVGGSFTYPCRFTLIAAMNPCPCGYYGTDRCRCKPDAVKKYQGKISGPILDRIDLQVTLKSLTTDERFAAVEDGASPRIRAKVEKARTRQAERCAGAGIPFNAAIPGGTVIDYCRFSPAAIEHYRSIIDAHTLSTRSMDRLAKVARTVADLDDSEALEQRHLDSAARFVIGGTLRDNL